MQAPNREQVTTVTSHDSGDKMTLESLQEIANTAEPKDLYQMWIDAESEYARNPTRENRAIAWLFWKARHPTASPYHF